MRLVEYLEMRDILDKVQCGSRKGRSTNDHLVRLEAGIRTAFSREDYYVAVFFDLEKAYDRAWRYGIVEDVYDAGLRGRLTMFIREYLKNRTISVSRQLRIR